MTHDYDLPVTSASELCAGCGADHLPDAQFCAECGARLMPSQTGVVLPLPRTQDAETEPAEGALQDAEPAVGVPLGSIPEGSATPTGRRWSRGRLAGAAGLLLAVILVAVLALNDRGTHQRLTHSRAAYHASQSTLAQRVADLSASNADLASTKATLASVQDALKAKEQALAGVSNSLSDARNNLSVKAGQIQTLKSCLNGVQIALSDLAYSDYSGALSALQAVEVSCNAANKIV